MADAALSTKLRPGDVISKVDENGVKRYRQYAGDGVWNDIEAPQGHAIGSPTRALTPDDTKYISSLREQADSARRLNTSNQRAVTASNRLNAGPYRGLLLDAAIPNPDNSGGFLDTAGAAILGPIARVTGAISPRDIKDYQTVKQAQNMAVLDKQIAQKGSQTEKDAARMAMTGVSVSNVPTQNVKVSAQDAEAAAYLNAKSQFAAQWASKYGVSGTDPQGRDMVTAFQQQYDATRARPNAQGITIRRKN